MQRTAVIVIAIGVGWVAMLVAISLCSMVYYDGLATKIQMDPRYTSDPEWRKRADSALMLSGAGRFAIKEGIIDSLPRWLRVGRHAGCITLVVLALVAFSTLVWHGR
jgi:hypothetical protein